MGVSLGEIRKYIQKSSDSEAADCGK